MLLFRIFASIFNIFLILFLVEVNSQEPSDDSQQWDRFRSCPASSYCVPIGRCPTLHDGWNRRGVGITCGQGSGRYRMVCCPRGYGREALVRQTRGTTTTTTPVPTPGRGNSEDCGLSQGMDWLQEHHAMKDEDFALEATWPWMAAIYKKRASGYPLPVCSGFLIDKIHVLTAAHCFMDESDMDEGLFTIHVGSDDRNLSLGLVYPVSEIKKHENFIVATYTHDIAILTLAREVYFPNFVPICLPDDRIASLDMTGWGATVLGWGLEDGLLRKDLKQLNNVPILSNEECKETHPLYFGITEKMMCTGQTETGRDSCSGDSGAPVMILYRKRWFAVGLVSFGIRGCSIPGIPTANTRLSSYMDWIRQNIDSGSYPIENSTP